MIMAAVVAYLVDRQPFGFTLARLFPSPTGLVIFGIIAFFTARWSVKRQFGPN